MPSFGSSRARVRRARQLAADLTSTFTGPTSSYYDLSTSSNPDGSYRLVARISPGFVTECGLVTSDALHNLRSALDETFCQLVRLIDPDDNCDGRFFPTYLTKPKPTEFAKAMAKLPPGAAAIIDRLQPYHRGDPDKAGRVPIRVLHDLNRWDKHRFLSIIRPFPAFPFETETPERVSGTAFLMPDGYVSEVTVLPNGWTEYAGRFVPQGPTVMGPPRMVITWGWYWPKDAWLTFVDRTLLTLADEVDRVLNQVEPVLQAGVSALNAKWSAEGTLVTTQEQWLRELERPL